MPTKAKQVTPDEQKVVVAQQFQLVDKKGRLRALLDTWGDDGLPILQLHDQKQMPRVIISIDGRDTPHVSLTHPSGEVAANMRVFDDGRIVIGVYDKGQKPVFDAGIDINGDHMIELFDKDGKLKWRESS